MRTGPAFIQALALLLSLPGSGSWARAESPARPFVPHTVEEALKELRHSQASDGDWAKFPDRSSVTMRSHGQIDGNKYEEEIITILERDVDNTNKATLQVLG